MSCMNVYDCNVLDMYCILKYFRLPVQIFSCMHWESSHKNFTFDTHGHVLNGFEYSNLLLVQTTSFSAVDVQPDALGSAGPAAAVHVTRRR